jgi:hypothetical protein
MMISSGALPRMTTAAPIRNMRSDKNGNIPAQSYVRRATYVKRPESVRA